jgi:uncharacterized tellurite resistance protein B-like protein
MEVQRPNQSVSLDDLKDLEKLKAIIEKATADGKLTEAEIQTVRTVIYADGQITPQEMELVQQLIYDKLQSGELEMSW